MLAAGMAEAGDDVWGVDRPGGAGCPAIPDAQRLSGDVTDASAIDAAIEASTPDAIVHLAALSSVRQSFDRPGETIVTNTTPALHLLDRLRRSGDSVRMLAVGSADEYGTVAPNELPVNESRAASPPNPYALAKSIQNHCCRVFHQLYGVDVVITRSFNHTGPGQRDDFVLPSFARQVAEIKLGRREPVMKVGNLDVRRDFLDVRDVCRAYQALLDSGKAGETYNVCSGQSYSVRDMLDTLCKIAGVDVDVQVDPDRLRPVDTPELRGDPSRIAGDTGWSPRISIDETLRDLLNYWEDRVRGES